MAFTSPFLEAELQAWSCLLPGSQHSLLKKEELVFEALALGVLQAADLAKAGEVTTDSNMDLKLTVENGDIMLSLKDGAAIAKVIPVPILVGKVGGSAPLSKPVNHVIVLKQRDLELANGAMLAAGPQAFGTSHIDA